MREILPDHHESRGQAKLKWMEEVLVPVLKTCVPTAAIARTEENNGVLLAGMRWALARMLNAARVLGSATALLS
jgi:hypothetical protein